MTLNPMASAATGVEQPVELGQVRWMRDFASAQDVARESERPMLILFDEVPGCHTCVSYGETVLSHPLVVEAAEDLFVPVAVYNNVDGSDRAVLESFDEPTWSNPVVRIVSADRKSLSDRVSGDYTISGLTDAMCASLDNAGEQPPAWLLLLNDEAAMARVKMQTIVFAMHCFWEGEAHLGSIDGVAGTRVGFLDGHEVVEVTYDPNRINTADLIRSAKKLDCAHRVYARNAEQLGIAREFVGDDAELSNEKIQRSLKDEKFRVLNSRYRALPMTELQLGRVNAAISEGEDPDRYLSPRQLHLLSVIRRHPEANWADVTHAESFKAAWRETWSRSRELASEDLK